MSEQSAVKRVRRSQVLALLRSSLSTGAALALAVSLCLVPPGTAKVVQSKVQRSFSWSLDVGQTSSLKPRYYVLCQPSGELAPPCPEGFEYWWFEAYVMHTRLSICAGGEYPVAPNVVSQLYVEEADGARRKLTKKMEATWMPGVPGIYPVDELARMTSGWLDAPTLAPDEKVVVWLNLPDSRPLDDCDIFAFQIELVGLVG